MSRVQYGIWPNCCNACDFCLNLREQFYSKSKQIQMLENVIENIDCLDWVNTYYNGISLLGGELYFITDKEVQDKFMELVDVIINKIIKKVNSPICKYSTVTNGLYNPEFLFRVLDKFKENKLLDCVDLNFSYDLKYRYKTDERRLLCESTIKAVTSRYPELKVNIQTIVTQHLITEYFKNNKIFDEWQNKFGVARVNFLFPHKNNTDKILTDFYLNRRDLLRFLFDLNEKSPDKVKQFVNSIIDVDKNSYIGLYRRNFVEKNNIDTKQPPLKEDIKSIINPNCGHSVMYQCYEDSDKCLYCDIRKLSC